MSKNKTRWSKVVCVVKKKFTYTYRERFKEVREMGNHCARYYLHSKPKKKERNPPYSY